MKMLVLKCLHFSEKPIKLVAAGTSDADQEAAADALYGLLYSRVAANVYEHVLAKMEERESELKEYQEVVDENK